MSRDWPMPKSDREKLAATIKSVVLDEDGRTLDEVVARVCELRPRLPADEVAALALPVLCGMGRRGEIDIERLAYRLPGR